MSIEITNEDYKTLSTRLKFKLMRKSLLKNKTLTKKQCELILCMFKYKNNFEFLDTDFISDCLSWSKRSLLSTITALNHKTKDLYDVALIDRDTDFNDITFLELDLDVIEEIVCFDSMVLNGCITEPELDLDAGATK
tara:strand:+ start:742 stop:1152 length:411 start_codon:yes stop_codon:yes gene_type:complete